MGARELEDRRRKKARPNPCAAAKHSGQTAKPYRLQTSYTVGRKDGIIEILVNTNQLFVAKIAHYIRQFLPPQKTVLLTVGIDFCSFNETNN